MLSRSFGCLPTVFRFHQTGNQNRKHIITRGMFLSTLPTFFRLRGFLPHYRSIAMAAISDWKPAETQASVPYQVYTKPQVKSGQDERDYRLIQLSNGLQAVLVHDAEADMAAASLDVAVGHLSDPVRTRNHIRRSPECSQFCSRMTCLDSLTFVNISSSWLVSTSVILAVQILMSIAGNTEISKGKRIFRGMYFELVVISEFTVISVSRAKQWQLQRLHLNYKYQLLLQGCDICSSWCPRTIFSLFPLSVVFPQLHLPRAQCSRL